MFRSRYFHRSRWDAERVRELDAYLAIETDENIARGMSAGDAHAAARRKLGNVTAIREEIYLMNTIGLLEALRLDGRDAWRQLRRRPMVTLLAVLLMTIGIGASTAAFSVAYGVLVRAMPYPDADRLAVIWEQEKGQRGQISYPDFVDLRAAVPLDAAAALSSGRATLTAPGIEADRVNTVQADPALLPLLGARPALGRLLASTDQGQAVTLISHRLWRSALHGDPAIVGKALSVSGSAYTVVGVAAPGFDFELPVAAATLGAGFTIKDVDLWMAFNPQTDVIPNRSVSNYEAIVKLRPGQTIGSVQAALDVAASGLARAYPDTNRARSFAVVPLHESIVTMKASAIALAAAGSALVLIVACVNLISLFLGELPARRRDFALREALGASRSRLFRQVALESLLLAAAGGLAGLLLAHGLVRSFTAAAELPRLDAIRFDAPVGLFSMAVAAAAGLVARLLPMLRMEGASRGLRASVSGYGISAPRLRRALVTGQLALALLLSATAALFGLSFSHLLDVDPGFNPKRALSVRVSAYASRYPARADATRFFNDLVDRAAVLPGVAFAGAGSALPLTGSGAGTSVAVEGRVPPMADRPSAGWQTVTPGYFAAVGIPLRAGRDFTRADLDRQTHQVIVNQTLARLLFGDADPIGRRLVLGPEARSVDWHEIVGVVGDVHHTTLATAATPHVYDLFGQHWSRTLFLVARTPGDPRALVPLIRGEVHRLDPQAPVFDVRSLDDIVDAAVDGRRASSLFASGLAGISLLLAALGVYGLLTSTVAARMREFGIRRALGSSSAQIVRLIFAEGAWLAAVGVPLGLALALASGRLIESQLFGVQAGNPRVLTIVAAILVSVAAAAACLPAHRAARIDPAVILKEE